MSTRLPVDSGGLSAATVEIYKIFAHGWGDSADRFFKLRRALVWQAHSAAPLDHQDRPSRGDKIPDPLRKIRCFVAQGILS